MNTKQLRPAFRKLSMEALCVRQLMASDIAMIRPQEDLAGIASEEASKGEFIGNPLSVPYAKGVKIGIDLIPGLNAQGINNDPWISNQSLDIDRDGYVTSLDALVLANDLNNPDAVYEKALDVNADGFVSSLDCLVVINFINNHSSQHVFGGGSFRIISDWTEPIEETTEQDEEAGRAAIDFISELIHVKREDLVLERVSRVDWSNTSLGLGRVAFQAITPGYQAFVRHGDILHEVRSSLKGVRAYGGYKLIVDQSQIAAPAKSNGSVWSDDDSSLASLEGAIDSIASHVRIGTR